MSKYLLSIVGPTAIGKTSLSLKLAEHFYTEIISADSRQFYKEMRIGTAVPSNEELSLTKHHFIQHKSIHEDYNVGTFEKDALDRLEILFNVHNTVIIVGGSGLYTDVVTHGLDDFPSIDASIREKLNSSFKNEGLEPLKFQLKQLDPKSYATIAIDNPHRLIRALEICIGSGKPYSSFITKGNSQRGFKTISVGLIADREIIYNRINERVDIMMNSGLLKEAKKLYPFKNLNALNTVGYKELFKYFDKEWDLEFAVSEIKKNTRRFAKRQLTWYRKNTDISWFDYETPIEEIRSHLNKKIKNPA